MAPAYIHPQHDMVYNDAIVGGGLQHDYIMVAGQRAPVLLNCKHGRLFLQFLLDDTIVVAQVKTAH